MSLTRHIRIRNRVPSEVLPFTDGITPDPFPVSLTVNAAGSDLDVVGVEISVYAGPDCTGDLLANESFGDVSATTTSTFTTSWVGAPPSFKVDYTVDSIPLQASFNGYTGTITVTHPELPPDEEMTFMGASADFVGAWSYGTNGYPDVCFEFIQNRNVAIESMLLSVPGNSGWYWSTSNGAYYPIGVSINGGSSLFVTSQMPDLELNNFEETVRVFACTVSTGGYTGLSWNLAVTYADSVTVNYIGTT